MTTCTYPKGDSADPCRRKAVSVYVVGGEFYYRCKTHDGKAARAFAEEKGIERRSIEAAA